MLTIEEIIDNTLVVAIDGKVVHSDYTDTLVPAVERLLADHEVVNMCALLGENFDGYALRAMVDDAKMGIKHWKAWGKIAIVGASPMLKNFIKIGVGWMMRGRVQCFDDKASAMGWMTEKH